MNSTYYWNCWKIVKISIHKNEYSLVTIEQIRKVYPILETIHDKFFVAPSSIRAVPKMFPISPIKKRNENNKWISLLYIVILKQIGIHI